MSDCQTENQKTVLWKVTKAYKLEEGLPHTCTCAHAHAYMFAHMHMYTHTCTHTH